MVLSRRPIEQRFFKAFTHLFRCRMKNSYRHLSGSRGGGGLLNFFVRFRGCFAYWPTRRQLQKMLYRMILSRLSPCHPEHKVWKSEERKLFKRCQIERKLSQNSRKKKMVLHSKNLGKKSFLWQTMNVLYDNIDELLDFGCRFVVFCT